MTIIDDDKPGQLCWGQTGTLQALGSEEELRIPVIRKNGSDGVVTVEYATGDIDATDHTATAGVDYEAATGTLKF